jgi:hypothetical protein
MSSTKDKGSLSGNQLEGSCKSKVPNLTSFQGLVMPLPGYASCFNHDQSMSAILPVIASIVFGGVRRC